MSDQLREAAQGALAQQLSSRFMEEHAVIPLEIDRAGAVVLACGRPLDATVTDAVARLFGRPVALASAPIADIHAAILGARPHAAVAEAPADGEPELGDLRAQANDAPVVQLVNAMLSDAIRTGASDVHLESTRDGIRVRLRLDGVLRDVATYSRVYQAGAISRVKLLAGLDIAERRLPQDGRARVRLGASEVDLRVSTLPALHGESVVIRLLDHGGAARDLASLGMPPRVEEAFLRVVSRTSGLILATGPTGSGKTTALYAALARRNVPGVKILTIEDPIEYQVPGIVQMQVNRKAGLDFSGALRSMLRHDPDIIMVGEMRDRETAEVAVQAALTGHLVFSTLHTNDAPSGVTRLVDMGIEPFLVSATVSAILAQRLVRTVCHACHGVAGRDCSVCNGSGYRGRTGLFELFVPDDEARQLIVERAPLGALRAAAIRTGMVPLAAAGESLAQAGITTRDEVLRVTSELAD